MTTYELKEYRQNLEEALSLPTLPPLYAPRRSYSNGWTLCWQSRTSASVSGARTG